MSETITYLAALERHLGIHRNGRVVGTLPDFVQPHGLTNMPIVAPEREIAKAEEAIRQFAQALEADPRTSIDALVLPEIDPSEDPNTIYSDLTPTERALVDLRFAAAAS